MATITDSAAQGTSHLEVAAGRVRSPDERIAELEARIAADRLSSPSAQVEPRDPLEGIDGRRRSRARGRWARFLVGLALGAGGTLLVVWLVDPPAPQRFDAAALAGSLSSKYSGPPFECRTRGGGFECLQPAADGGTTLQVRLDHRGCWEAKPASAATVLTAARGCIGSPLR